MNNTLIAAGLGLVFALGAATPAFADDTVPTPEPTVIEEPVIEETPIPDPVFIPYEGDGGPVFPCDHPKAGSVCYIPNGADGYTFEVDHTPAAASVSHPVPVTLPSVIFTVKHGKFGIFATHQQKELQ